MKLLCKLLKSPRDNSSPVPGRPVRFSDHPVEAGDIISTGNFDASQHVVTAVGSTTKTWDDEFQFHRDLYPYQARMATLEDLEAAAKLSGKTT